MGSDSDLHIMREAAEILDHFAVSYELRIISAHRTPEAMLEYAHTAMDRGLKVIIAGAEGAGFTHVDPLYRDQLETFAQSPEANVL